ncbi:hypothetical protein EV188_10489 [Actinomycetospora succinea]|uniref:Uncharacterized protein n=1 Tax=Actinomycetospora succinea TaxID=663603 RepID=A0A4R6VDB3_9PSEU|nr:hypothetical protein [Actinomycetospora succinea]TDQ58350.1 hypothetical protein EV188_10489 [Actinomycetospora succinea]
MRLPFGRRRSTTSSAAGGATAPPRATTTARHVPGPDVMVGMEYLDLPAREPVRIPAPEVAVCGIDPQVPGTPAVPRLHVVVGDDGPRPDSVSELLERAGGAGGVRVRRLTVDVRGLRDVLESRGGWNLLAALVREPSDRVTNAVFRATMAGPAPDGPGPVGAVLEDGDVDVEVCVVGEGDTVAGRCRRELGRGRLSLTTFLAESERLTRRLAEALARPRDRGTRRSFEQALGDVLADAPLSELLGRHREAPYCSVPGTWATPPTPATPAPRRSDLSEQVEASATLEEAAR